MITSLQNAQVKNIIKLNQKAKERREQRLFAAEGRKMFLEAPSGWIHKVYVSESAEKDEELMKRVRLFPWEAVTDTVFRQMSDTQTPQGILTVLHTPLGSRECGNDSPHRRRSRRQRCFSYKDLCGYYKSKGDTCYNGVSLQNAFCVCGGCAIFEEGSGKKRNSSFCRSFAG